MTAQFVNVKVTTDSQSDIYVDNELKGKGSWTGRLPDGEHVFEAKKASHKPTLKNAYFVIGHDENIIIPDPEPIYGTVDVNSTPLGATIYIDDKKYGTSPKVLDDVLIGKHRLRLEKEGYATVTKNINIDENGITYVAETLKTAPQQNNNHANSQSSQMHTSTSNNNGTTGCEAGFITLNLGLDSYSKLMYGVTFGIHYRNSTSWFGSFYTNSVVPINSQYTCGNDYLVNGCYPSYTGKTKFRSTSLIGGVILRDTKALSYRLGIGYGIRNVYTVSYDGNTLHASAYFLDKDCTYYYSINYYDGIGYPYSDTYSFVVE